MRRTFGPTTRAVSGAMLGSTLLAVALVMAGPSSTAQTPPSTNSAKTKLHHRPARKKPAPEPVVEAPPPPPPMPHWPINDNPNPASVVWDATGLRVNASNSSLQQILNEISTETGTKVVGSVPDQRIFGSYGPGQAGDVISQLLQGSGYNILLAGDLGHGTPSQIVLTPRRAGTANGQNNGMNRARSQEADQEVADEPEPDEQPQPPVQPLQPPPNQAQPAQPGFGPNGPMRTPQQVMEEMQQRQLLQQQQQQQGTPTAPQANPQ